MRLILEMAYQILMRFINMISSYMRVKEYSFLDLGMMGFFQLCVQACKRHKLRISDGKIICWP